jgi:hypothetical protein
MAWTPPPYRKRDSNVLFAVNYADGRSAYITLSPKKLESETISCLPSPASCKRRARFPPARSRA